MHLLAAEAGRIDDGAAAVDLGQTPADIVFLSAADSEISGIAAAQRRLLAEDPARPTLRAASLLQLRHNFSVDLYIEAVISGARLVVVRLLGGQAYWPYGVERLIEVAAREGVKLVLLPGDDRPDPGLAELSTLDSAQADLLWRYLIEGGPVNAASFLRAAARILGGDEQVPAPVRLPHAGLYQPGGEASYWQAGRPVAAIVFYRALMQAGNLAPVDALIEALAQRGFNPLPLYAQGLKDPESAAELERLLDDAPPDVILNATAFAAANLATGASGSVFDRCDCPVLQIPFAGGGEAEWRAGTRGLDPRDLAMNVVLPEVDGRIVTRAVSFKERAPRDSVTEADLTLYRPVADRIDFVADLAAGWSRLRRTPVPKRRVGFVLGNYPVKDGRLGNGVGLDTPASMISALQALAEAGYHLDAIPADGDALMRLLGSGPTNADPCRAAVHHLPLDLYRLHFDALPAAVRDQVAARWGDAAADRWCDGAAFRVPVVSFGNIAVGLQPARGYDLDPAATYHAPDLVPPHAYFAFYIWLRHVWGVQALVHMGKHGTLEWLPGKSVALSAECFPEAVLGPVPHLYPFIVNDPGEGTQAKRRAAAVIIDHLTPPLTRAETYGTLARLEALVDEYYAAMGLDRGRLELLAREILDLAGNSGLDRDSGISAAMETGEALRRLDAWLCDIKESQIRDGLHIFGRSPDGTQRRDLLLALARAPRGGKPAEASLLRALADDLQLGFDPLLAPPGTAWEGARPAALTGESAWRSAGDTVERLEMLAARLVDGEQKVPMEWRATSAVLDWMQTVLAPALDRCGQAEIAGLLAGLDGRFVVPGPSGAPSRGRPDVLPTGRNFYSLDTRLLPTAAAWTLGWRSASALIERHAQEHGDFPRRVALSVWGTSTMRTGGDDIAQAMALMGVRPLWETATGRVSGFEILPASILDRPRVDVTLRVSGFFRDAFGNLIDLFDAAARAVAALDESPDVNPLAESVRLEAARAEAEGVSPAIARNRAASRIFGAKPGAYGAGLQALIDEGGWQGRGDFAEAFLTWGSWSYGAGGAVASDRELLARRLSAVQIVLHNQDNREHDLLDSDDYYQFEGGLAATIEHLSGQRPTIYHNDHSRPEAPRIRTLGEEIARVVRSRAVNPKWLAGVMRHGYKGAFELAATVDYLFAFAATTGAVSDAHFDAVFDAYLTDPIVATFLDEHNPAAKAEIAARLAEAIDRGLWHPRRNSARSDLAALMTLGIEE